jgi:hypothetical protein
VNLFETQGLVLLDLVSQLRGFRADSQSPTSNGDSQVPKCSKLTSIKKKKKSHLSKLIKYNGKCEILFFNCTIIRMIFKILN